MHDVRSEFRTTYGTPMHSKSHVGSTLLSVVVLGSLLATGYVQQRRPLHHRPSTGHRPLYPTSTWQSFQHNETTSKRAISMCAACWSRDDGPSQSRQVKWPAICGLALRVFFFSVTLAAPNLAKLSKLSHVRLRASPQEAMSSNLELSQALHLPRPCSARAKLAHDDSALAPEVPGHRCSPPASNLPLFQSSLERCILPKLLAHLKRG
jgi:hypothetical protein